MKFINYYIGIIFLCVVGGAAVKFLIPTPQALALMYMDSGMYDEAQKRYEIMLAQGDDSGNVVIPLAKIYDLKGESQKAMGLLVKYINKNPDLKDARELLKVVYKNSLKSRDFIKILENLASISSSGKMLAELSEWYETTQQDTSQVELLTRLVKGSDYKLKESDYDKLILYYSVNRKYDESSALIHDLMRKGGRKVSRQSILFSVMVLANSERFDQAIQLAKSYLYSRTPLPFFEVEQMVGVFLKAGKADMAKKLLLPFIKENPDNVTLKVCQYQIEIAKGLSYRLLRRLRQDFYGDKIKSSRILEIMLKLALRSDDAQLVLRILTKINMRSMPGDIIFKCTFYALKNQNAEIAELLRKKMPSKVLRLESCLNYLLFCAGRKITVRKMIAEIHLTSGLDDEDKIQLAYLLYHNDFPQEAYELIKGRPGYQVFPIFRIRELVRLIINFGDPDSVIRKYSAESRAEASYCRSLYRDSMLLIAAGGGYETILKSLLKEYGDSPVEALVDAYSMAMSNGQHDIAVVIARKLRKQNRDNVFVLMLGKAMFEDGDYNNTLSVLMPIMTKYQSANALFLRAAAAAIKNNGYYSLPRRISSLIDPALAKVRNNKDATISELKSAAVCYAAIGNKEEGEKIYLSLCRQGNVTPGDIDEFVKLCDKQPSPAVKKWFVDQAETDQVYRSKNIEWLNKLGLASESVRIIQRIYRYNKLGYLAEYLKALDMTGNESELSSLIEQYSKGYRLDRLLKTNVGEKVAMIFFLTKKYNIDSQYYKESERHSVISTEIKHDAVPPVAHENPQTDLVNVAPAVQKAEVKKIALNQKDSKQRKIAAELAIKLVKSLKINELIMGYNASSIADIYVSSGMTNEGIKLFKTPNLTGKSFDIILYLYAFSGKKTFIEDWLKNSSETPENTLVSLYSFLKRGHHIPLALKVAERLYKLNKSNVNRIRYARSLIECKKYQRALELVEAKAENNIVDGQLYLAAIVGLEVQGKFKRNTPAAEKFLRICEKILKEPDVSEADISLVAFALSSTKYFQRAVKLFYKLAKKNPTTNQPFLKQYLYLTTVASGRKDFKHIRDIVQEVPERQEDELVSLLHVYNMYGQIMMLLRGRYKMKIPNRYYPLFMYCLLKCRLMKDFKRYANHMPSPSVFSINDRIFLLSTFILAMEDEKAAEIYKSVNLKDMTISTEMIRRLGYAFANKREYAQAIPIFLDLATLESSPESSDTLTLVAMLKYHKNAKALKWISSMAEKTKGMIQVKWLQTLSFLDHPGEIIKILRAQYGY